MRPAWHIAKRVEAVADVPVGDVLVGDKLLVRAGEVIPVDGFVSSLAATIDESAVTGEPIPEAAAARLCDFQRCA